MDIEKIIQENREAFDSNEPGAGHFKRFDDKLDKKFGQEKKRNYTFYLKIAAVFALGLMSTFWLYEKFSTHGGQNGIEGIALSDISAEYAEVEVYFTSSINNSLNDLNPYIKDNEELKEELLGSEFEELDSLYRDLQKELANNPDDEQIIEAMIVHYQTKLEIISIVLNQLKKVKTHKNQENEKTEI